ncbi:MAG TPA: O-antigen ligase family protein [Thermoanaerobaculia bacterium]|nr:O-antigen ligase family protein [Thermoanaerobaculia bacterium]
MKPALRSSARRAKPPLDFRLGTFFLWLLVLAAPFALAQVAKESFREPKRLAGEWLALASLACFAWGLRRVETVRLAEVWRLPAVQLIVPCLLVATAGLAASRHPLQVREALIDLWIGAAALVGWSVALPVPRLERLLRGLLWPATLMALLGILQYYGFQPLALAALSPDSRLAITSLAGNPADLAAYLVLPCLVAQSSLGSRRRGGEEWKRPGVWGTALALAVTLYAMLLTQTLAAVAAIVAGSLLLWAPRAPRRRAAALLVAAVVAAALVIAAVPPLRYRVMQKSRALAHGEWNWVLTGRLDGWRAAVWMLREHPLTGVGQGAYGAEFAPAKLALLDRGVRFFTDLKETGFANAHNEFLEVGAEWGIPGLLALAWALWVLLAALTRGGRAGRGPEDRALAWAGTAALGILSLVDFPFRIALVAFPALLFLSWVLCPEEHEEEVAA